MPHLFGKTFYSISHYSTLSGGEEMKFCPKCGSIMLPDKKKGVFVCRKCGYEEPINPEDAKKYRITQKVEHKPDEGIIIVEQDVATLPKVKITCPKCGNDEAYWWSSRRGLAMSRARYSTSVPSAATYGGPTSERGGKVRSAQAAC